MNFVVKLPAKLVSLKTHSNSTRHKMLKINNKIKATKRRVTINEAQMVPCRLKSENRERQ